MVFDALGVEANNVLVLLNRQLEDLVGLRAVLHIAEGAQVNAAQKAVRLEIVAVALENVLGFENRVLDAPGASVQFSEPRVQIVGGRVVLDGQTVLVDGLAGVLRSAIHRDHLFVDMGHGEVIVGRRLIRSVGRRGGSRRFGVLIGGSGGRILRQNAQGTGSQKRQQGETGSSLLHSVGPTVIFIGCELQRGSSLFYPFVARYGKLQF